MKYPLRMCILHSPPQNTPLLHVVHITTVKWWTHIVDHGVHKSEARLLISIGSLVVEIF
jgi:hypothetical protein